VERARELWTTGRYLELRLENMELEGLFEFVGLNPHPNCAAEMGLPHLPSNFKVKMPELTAKQIVAIPNLRDSPKASDTNSVIHDGSRCIRSVGHGNRMRSQSDAVAVAFAPAPHREPLISAF
jgi:hypothetical protein